VTSSAGTAVFCGQLTSPARHAHLVVISAINVSATPIVYSPCHRGFAVPVANWTWWASLLIEVGLLGYVWGRDAIYCHDMLMMFLCKLTTCTVNWKKHTKTFLLYLLRLRRLVDSDKIWYTLSWIKLRYSK